MHISQTVWNWLLFLWTSFHDFIYLGIYWCITNMPWKKHLDKDKKL